MNSRIILFAALSSYLAGQILSVIDTIHVPATATEIQLRHNLIIDSTFIVNGLDNVPFDYVLDAAQGVVSLPSSKKEPRTLVVRYNHFSDLLPLRVGPKWLQLPLVDSLIYKNNLPIETSSSSTPIIQNTDPLFTAGTVYRTARVSPITGSEFTGGLRMQIQGNLGPDLQISGVLSDQNLPIQPEGNTKTLDEIDKVYLQVNHDNFLVTAGDIDVSYSSGKFMNIDRKMIGLNNNFKYKEWSGSAVFAGSKGKLNQVEFKGVDGKQGPYKLTSGDGSRDIIILAGSERVWLNGMRMVRGENNDYTVDYAIGELTFMPRHLIYFDSDIYVEYQYSDAQYNRSVLGTSMKRNLRNKGNIQLNWLREFDQALAGEDQIDSEIINLFNNVGDKDVQISGATQDTSGAYVFVDSIYVFDPADTILGNHFNVAFTYDGFSGEYARKVTINGTLYYEWMGNNDLDQMRQTMDLYSPVRKLVKPESQQMVQVVSYHQLNDWMNLSLELAISDHDQNSYSSVDDADNQGIGHEVELSGQKIPLGEKIFFGYQVSDWSRTGRFHTLQRDRSVNFNQDWNIPVSGQERERLRNVGATLTIDSLGAVNGSFSQYEIGSALRKRILMDFHGTTALVPSITGNFNQVQYGNDHFNQINFAARLLPGRIHPVINYSFELSEKANQFEHFTSGVEYGGEKLQTIVTIGRREDHLNTEDALVLLSRGYFGEFDLRFQTHKGWNQSLIYRKRIKTQMLEEKDLDYDLAQARIFFRKPYHPLRLDVKIKLEETLTENRATVYDSVGIGLGTYRYDPQFEEYVSDPNGAYIAYTILTGSRKPTTQFEGIQRLEYDFGKRLNSKFKDIKYRLDWLWDFNGQNFSVNRYGEDDLNESTIIRSRSKLRHEWDYVNRTGRQIRTWWLGEKDLNNLDSRGADLRMNTELAVDWLEPISANTHAVVKLNQHDANVESGFSHSRDRSAQGTWAEIGIKKRFSSLWQTEALLQNGYDAGQHQMSNYSAALRGIRLDILHFFSSKGRLQGRFEWATVSLDGEATFPPPEAVRGHALGDTRKVNVQGHILLRQNFSINVTINYISDIRYDNFINITGEIRAYF